METDTEQRDTPHPRAQVNGVHRDASPSRPSDRSSRPSALRASHSVSSTMRASFRWIIVLAINRLSSGFNASTKIGRRHDGGAIDIGNRDSPLNAISGISHQQQHISRRDALVSIYGSTALLLPNPSNAYTVSKAEPNESDTYRMAQKRGHNLRVLWIGSGDNLLNNVRSKDLFRAGNNVTSLDLQRPPESELREAISCAKEQHDFHLKFVQGDATKMPFDDDSFDVVLSSYFLCQDFDPMVVVREVRRVLKPKVGLFGFHEHVPVSGVIVDVFGEKSIIKLEAYPQMTNEVGGVVRKS